MHQKNIRNFCIISHVDHGKSTLADRMLEATGTIEKRKMRNQVLDAMDLERERGITIKMQPVRMSYMHQGEEHVLNLIDTPGHIDFSYEVSRALKAVEGALLLVDATQGVQAQTLTTLDMARELGLTIIPVLSKIDSSLARVDEVRREVMELLNVRPDDVLLVSGKTGEGVGQLFEAIVEHVPAPQSRTDIDDFRALIFDFHYSSHRGIIVYLRVMDGAISKGADLVFKKVAERFVAGEVGIFTPDEKPVERLKAGEIGYIVTGIKKPGIASVGDTLTKVKSDLPALGGYMQPKPVVWASLYPESQDDFAQLRQALERLKLSDSSLSYEEEASGILGRGFRCGFLGMLHLEIVSERLRREFDLDLIVTTPSIAYDVTDKKGVTETIYSPSLFPDHGEITHVEEPWVALTIMTPASYLSTIMKILYTFEAEVGATEMLGSERASLSVAMPLRELMRNFFDELKSASAGYASLSYTFGEKREADVARLDVWVAEEPVPAFTRIVSRKRVQEEAEAVVERLHTVLPRQLFVTKIQARALGRILASRTLSALRKDVTGYLYGGDVTRKKKLLEKQKKGKKKMRERGKVNIPHEVFMKMMRND